MINLMTRQGVQDFVLSPSPQIGTQDLCCCLSTTNEQVTIGQTGGWTDRQSDGWTDRQTDEWTDRQSDGWTDRQSDGWTDRQSDGWIDRQINGWT